MLFSEALRRPVMSISSATTLGTLDGFVVDVKRPQIVALRLAGSNRVVEWDRIENFGPDAVTVANDEVPADQKGRVQALSDSRFALLNKRVLDDQGNQSGTVHDVEFDPESGQVTSVITSTGPLDGDRLIGCGPYAVVRARRGHSHELRRDTMDPVPPQTLPVNGSLRIFDVTLVGVNPTTGYKLLLTIGLIMIVLPLTQGPADDRPAHPRR